MRIIQVNPLPGNPIPALYEAKLAARHHTMGMCTPSTAGAGRASPLKVLAMPGRVLGLQDVVRQLRPRHYDVAHIHWASYSFLGLRSHIPYLVHCHGSDVRYRLRKGSYRALLGPGLRRAAAVLYATPDLADVVRSVRPDAIFMPVPIDVESFTPEDARPDRPFTVMLFGRLEPGKGSATAMEGIVRFAERHPDARVMTIDWGILSKDLQRHYGHRVEFLPRTTPDRMQQIVRQADVVVGQIVLGALGLSEFEAMSCAKPVIASFRYSDVYAAPPPIGNATSAEEIEQWLERLYQQPEQAAALGRDGRAWVRAHHDSDVLIQRLEQIYAAALS